MGTDTLGCMTEGTHISVNPLPTVDAGTSNKFAMEIPLPLAELEPQATRDNGVTDGVAFHPLPPHYILLQEPMPMAVDSDTISIGVWRHHQ